MPRRAQSAEPRGGRDRACGGGRLSAASPLTAAERRAILTRARALFNAGDYWQAHETLETVWRSIIRHGVAPAAGVPGVAAAEAAVWQGLIQAAAALLHLERGNRHGVAVVGGAALGKLAGAQRPEIEFETVEFRAQLARTLAGEGGAPRLEFRAHDGDGG